MKLRALSGDQELNVEISSVEDRVVATIEGRQYHLKVSEPEPDVFLIKHQGKVHEFHVDLVDRGTGSYVVSSRDGEVELSLFDPRNLRAAAGQSEGAGGVAEVRTAMPGKVVRILREAGSEVAKGDGVVVVEAMKMQNDLKAPRSGIVREIRVKQGQTVGAGEVLAVID